MFILRAIACLASMIVAWPLAANAEGTLRFARIENIPDQFVGGEILKAVYGRLNIPIELVDLPAKRALIESSSGRIDGEVHRNINVRWQYPSLIMVEPAINYIEPSAFAKTLRFEVKGWDSLRAYRIGIVRGVGTSEDGTRGMPQVQTMTSIEQLMQALDADRVDIAVSDAFSGLAVLDNLHLQRNISLLKPRLQRNDIYHFVHEKHRALVPSIEQVLREMQASGELEALRAKAIERYFEQEARATHAN